MVTSRTRLIVPVAVAMFLGVVIGAAPGQAKCDPTTDPDKTDIANARAAVATHCDCTGVTRHGAYVSCAVQQAKTVLTNKSCAGFVKKCAANSTCGKLNAVTCCLTTTSGTACKIKKNAAHCTAKQGTVGVCTSCCDACPGPGMGASCPTTTSTTATTSTTLPCQYDGTSCVGSCGGSEMCVLLDTITRSCGCAAPPVCQSSAYPTCGGNCPSGFACQAVKVGTAGGCRCVEANATCPSGTGATCTQGCQIETVCADGRCPPGQACLATFFGDPNPVCGCGEAFTKLRVTTVPGSTSCGGVGLSPNPAAPFSGELDSDIAGTTKILDLGLACLYIGGGFANATPPARIPDGASTIFGLSGGSTLTASSGTGPKDCTQGPGPSKTCANTPDPQTTCSSDTDCPMSGQAACQPTANCFFGAPVPLPSPVVKSLSFCVLNVIGADASGTIDQTTGDASITLPLSLRMYATGNFASPCPKCVSGTCNTGAKAGSACTPVGSFMTTLDCPPDPTKYLGSFPISPSTLTTGTASAVAADGFFCPGQPSAGAFGVATGNCTGSKTPFECCTGSGTGSCDPRRIAETGSPGGNLTDGAAHDLKTAAVFCIPTTDNMGVDQLLDLPGPGAIGGNYAAQLLP